MVLAVVVSGATIVEPPAEPHDAQPVAVVAEPLTSTVAPPHDVASIPPTGRFGASVVWMGDEVLITGGWRMTRTGHSDELEFIADGAAFDPSTDTWRRIADQPASTQSWRWAFWTGEAVLIVGSEATLSYDPRVDSWTRLPDPPFELPDLVRDNETFEAVWSGDVLYMWRPGTDEMAVYDPDRSTWELMPGPELDSFPSRLLADGNRLVALGTGWPSSPALTTLDATAAEWIDGRWVTYEPITFVTATGSNIADVGAAQLIDGSVVVWGDHSDDPGPTYLLDPAGGWTEAPPMPIFAGTAHPGSIVIGDRILAFSESKRAAIFDPNLLRWETVDVPLDIGSSVWTGTEVLTWTGTELVRWTPPPTQPATRDGRHPAAFEESALPQGTISLAAWRAEEPRDPSTRGAFHARAHHHPHRSARSRQDHCCATRR